MDGQSWQAADRLFREDDQWVGGDGAYSFPVGSERTIWLFADSFISLRPGAPRSSTGSVMVNNSVGVQQGSDPTTATMRFYWRRRPDGLPAAFFELGDGGYLWPCNGVLLEGQLLLFAMRVRARAMTEQERTDSVALASFEVYGWVAIQVRNPYDEPSEWRVDYLDTWDARFATTIGAGSVFAEGDHLYAHASSRRQQPEQFLARWRIADVCEGRLAEPEWWYGDDTGWVAESRTTDDRPPANTLAEPQVEFTVHRDQGTGKLIWAQTNGLFEADLVLRTADRPEGPWSAFEPVFHPPEGDVDGGFVYAAKAHPEQTGADGDLVLTYNNNALRVETLMERPELYFPRFVRVRRP